jgi:hypothetical protein
MTRIHLGALAAPVLLAAFVAACGGQAGGEPSITPAGSPATVDAPASVAPDTTATLARPAAFDGLPLVELIAPEATDAGRAPTFTWGAVSGALAYRLSVLVPDGVAWAWQGDATSVRYGGVPDGVSGPSIVPGSWWSVAALDGDGSIVAMSELRAVSPTTEVGGAPSWAEHSGAGTTPTDTAIPSATPSDAGSGPLSARACDLLDAEEIHDAIKGDWLAPELAPYAEYSVCTWMSQNGSRLDLELWPADQYDPEGWGADGTIDGLGDDSYTVEHGWDRRIGFLASGITVNLLIDYTKVDRDGFTALARLVEGRID